MIIIKDISLSSKCKDWKCACFLPVPAMTCTPVLWLTSFKNLTFLCRPWFEFSTTAPPPNCLYSSISYRTAAWVSASLNCKLYLLLYLYPKHKLIVVRPTPVLATNQSCIFFKVVNGACLCISIILWFWGRVIVKKITFQCWSLRLHFNC